MSRDQTTTPRDPQTFLDEVFDRAVRLIEDGLTPEVDALIAGHEALRAEVDRLIRLAQQVAVGPAPRLPDFPGFTVLHEIGRGGMGTVYLARQESLGGRPVALKVLPGGAGLSAKARSRFLTEARAVARLHHPNIVAVHNVIEHEGASAYAMEWVEGVSLAGLIEVMASQLTAGKTRSGERDSAAMVQIRLALGDETGAIADGSPVLFFTRIGLAIARALATVHKAGLLHRDVKPSNILLRRSGSPLLADFGLAMEVWDSRPRLLSKEVWDSRRRLSSDESQPGAAVPHRAVPQTQAGQFAGTVAYAPPEQLRGESDAVDARGDVYALGVTLYHALTLRLPFDAREPSTMLRKIEAGAAEPLRKANSRVPRDLETIVGKAMEADPQRRYQSAEEMAADIERFLNFQPIRAKAAGWLTRGAKLVRRNRGAALGVTISSVMTLALSAAIVIYFFFLPGWVAGHVREARLALLDPAQANNIVSRLFWGTHSKPRPDEIVRQIAAFDRALAEYNAAVRLAPFDEAIRREREIVAEVRARSASEEGRAKTATDASIPTPMSESLASAAGSDRVSLAGAWGSDRDGSDRDVGLRAFLIGDSEIAIAAWSKWEQTRDPLAQPDPLVDAALGILYLFDDQAPRAYPRLQKAVEAFPNVGFLMEYLADAAAKCGDAERARRWLEESKRMSRRDTQGAAGRIDAGILAAEGKTEQAIAAYRSIPQSGFPQLELSRLLERERGAAEALPDYLALAQRLPNASRVQNACRTCSDRWWASLSKPQRHREIKAMLDADNPLATLLYRVLLHHGQSPPSSVAANPLRHSVSAAMCVDVVSCLITLPSWLRAFVASWLLPDFAALAAPFSSPPLESLSLHELAERMEVENMSLWSRIISHPTILKELQLRTWRWPVLRSASRLATSAFGAFDDEQKRRLRLSRLAAISAAVVLAVVTSQPAHGQCTTPPCFQGLGDLPGGTVHSVAFALSDDGTSIAGDSQSSLGHEGYRWRSATGMTGVGVAPGGGNLSSAEGISSDGSFLTGSTRSVNANCVNFVEAFRWSESTGLVLLGDAPGGCFTSGCPGINADGTVHGGVTVDSDGYRAAFWTQAAGWTVVGGNPSSFRAVSADGSVLAGGDLNTAIRWTSATGIVDIGDLVGGDEDSNAYDMTNNGTVLVGRGTSNTGSQGFRWTAGSGMVALEDLPEGAVSGYADDISPDGSLVVGSGNSAAGQEAVIWDFNLAVSRLVDVLAVHGVNIPPGWTLISGTGITRNGNIVTVCGNATNPQGNPEAWIARYTLPEECQPAVIEQSPADASAPFGGSAQFSVVASGTGQITYQWRKDNIDLVDGPLGCGGMISGATTDTLILDTVTVVDEGDYDCVVTNACGSDTSDIASLTVTAVATCCRADVNDDGQINAIDIQDFVDALLEGQTCQ